VYGNSLHCGFVFDDLSNIVDNENIHARFLTLDELAKSFSGTNPAAATINRPLSFLTLAINYALGGLDPFGYHIFNISIHTGCAILFYLVCLQLLSCGNRPEDYQDIALLAAVLWAIHPLQVTGVTYIVQRMASLTALFTLLSLYGYIRGRSRPAGRIRWFTLSAIAALGGMASKENGILIPASLVLVEIIFFTPAGKQQKKLLLAGTCIAAYMALGTLYISHSGILSHYSIRPFSMEQRLLTQPRVIFFYLSLIIYPLADRFTLLHDIRISESIFMPPSTLLSIIGLLVFLGVALRCHRQRPIFSFAVLFFFINHLIESTILPLELIYEHRNYLPALFLYLLLAIGLQQVLEYFSYRPSIKTLACITAVVLLFSIGHTTMGRNPVFKSEYTFWRDNIKKSPYLSRPHNNLGAYYWDRGVTELAFKESSIAVRLNRFSRLPLAAVAHENIGMYYLQTKNMYEKALQEFQKSNNIAGANTHPRTWYGMAIASLKLNRLDEADRLIKKGLALMPDFPEMLLVQGIIYDRSGVGPKALECFHKAARQNSRDSRAYMALAASYQKQGKLEQALNLWQIYATMRPDNPTARMAIVEIASELRENDLLISATEWLSTHKKNLTFREYIDQATSRQDDMTIYRPDPDRLLPIITTGLQLK
jgi:tetratricopeptide (TPR) repeat protein